MNCVNRCVCFETFFLDIEKLIDSSLTLQENFDNIEKITKCGTACGLCIPYIEDLISKKSKNK